MTKTGRACLRVEPGSVSDHIWAFWDFLPTVAEIVGVKPPSDTDGISFLPTLLGREKQKKHEYLYWEFRQDQSVRYGDYFAIRPNNKYIELYNLVTDPKQSKDLSSELPEIVKKIGQFMKEAHTPGDVWPSPGESEKEFKERLERLGAPERSENVGLF